MKQPAIEPRSVDCPPPLVAATEIALVDCDPGDETMNEAGADAASALNRAAVKNFQAPGQETTGESDLRRRQAPHLPDGF